MAPEHRNALAVALIGGAVYLMGPLSPPWNFVFSALLFALAMVLVYQPKFIARWLRRDPLDDPSVSYISTSVRFELDETSGSYVARTQRNVRIGRMFRQVFTPANPAVPSVVWNVVVIEFEQPSAYHAVQIDTLGHSLGPNLLFPEHSYQVPHEVWRVSDKVAAVLMKWDLAIPSFEVRFTPPPS